MTNWYINVGKLRCYQLSSHYDASVVVYNRRALVKLATDCAGEIGRGGAEAGLWAFGQSTQRYKSGLKKVSLVFICFKLGTMTSNLVGGQSDRGLTLQDLPKNIFHQKCKLAQNDTFRRQWKFAQKIISPQVQTCPKRYISPPEQICLRCEFIVSSSNFGYKIIAGGGCLQKELYSDCDEVFLL